MDLVRGGRPILDQITLSVRAGELWAVLGPNGAATSHALLLRAGRQLSAWPVDDVLTSDLVSACFGHPVTVTRQAGRWSCTARNGATP